MYVTRFELPFTNLQHFKIIMTIDQCLQSEITYLPVTKLKHVYLLMFPVGHHFDNRYLPMFTVRHHVDNR